MSYANRTNAPPETLTDEEVKRLLKVSGQHKDGFRDHVIFSVGVGTGLRESEIVGLNIGDVSPDGRRVRRTIQLRVFKRAARRMTGRRYPANRQEQRIHLPDGTMYKLQKFVRLRVHELGGPRVWPMVADKPLFAARTGARLSTRRVRELFHEWQDRARFDRRYNFHSLRHTFVTTIRRKTGDIRIAQRAARHANIASTARYDHPSDQEIIDATRKVPA